MSASHGGSRYSPRDQSQFVAGTRLAFAWGNVLAFGVGQRRSSEGDMHRVGLFFAVVLLSTTTLFGASQKTPWVIPIFKASGATRARRRSSGRTPWPGRPRSPRRRRRNSSGRRSSGCSRPCVRREVPISGELNEIWLETAKGKVPPGRSTSLVVDPPDGKIPYTPEGRKRWDAVPKMGKPMLANAPEDRNFAERCITTDGLLVPNPFYNNYFEIVQAPGSRGDRHRDDARGLASFLSTGALMSARACGCGRAIREGGGRGRHWSWRPGISTTRCSSVGRAPNCISSSDSPGSMPTRLTDTIEYRLTVTDPATFTRPWTLVNGLRRADGGIYEVACHEGNIGLRGILAGARAQEAK